MVARGCPHLVLGSQPLGGSCMAGGRGSRTNGHSGTLVCAAAHGPVSAAADTPSPLDCPRLTLGCQATFRPPVGLATRSKRCCALPHRSAPQRRTRKAPAPLRFARAIYSCHPPSPSRWLCGSLALLKVSGFAAPCGPQNYPTFALPE